MEIIEIRNSANELFRLSGQNLALQNRQILFAFDLGQGGCCRELWQLLEYLRIYPRALEGCTGGVFVHSVYDLYSKSAGRELVLAANLAGCAFPGRSLVEAIGNLQNFTVQARNGGWNLETACQEALKDLIRRISDSAQRLSDLRQFRRSRPKLTVLHASSRKTSNTLALWNLCQAHLLHFCDITEIGLRNGTLEDCAGCPYTTCLHYGERDDCFYGGVMVREVYPAVRAADAVILLAPNYNDALSANLTAAINRLTALYRTTSFSDKLIYALIVSGYSGGDIVASQIISALNMNKGFYLPPGFCVFVTANDPGSALALPDIHQRMERFAKQMLSQLCG